MTERPISLLPHEARALRENRKTQHRRTRGLAKINAEPDAWILRGEESPGLFIFEHAEIASVNVAIRCPFGVAGDRLWTRETWAAAVHGSYEAITGSLSGGSYYSVKIPWSFGVQHAADYYGGNDDYKGAWRPSIHMPRWASRDTLEVISARPERLQSITEADAIAEGCESSEITDSAVADFQISDNAPHLKALSRKLGAGSFTAKFDFMMLWDSINGKTLPWAKNPWGWRVEFRRITT